MPTYIEQSAIAVLYNFDASVEEIVITDCLRIVSVEFLLEEIESGKVSEALSKVVEGYENIGHGEYVLNYNYKGEVDDPFNDNYDRWGYVGLFNDLLVSLRILDISNIGIVMQGQATSYVKNDPVGIEFLTGYGKPIHPFSLISPDRYKFNETDLEQLITIFSKVGECENEQILIAMRRLANTYGDRELDDKLIDVMIAFEAIYLKDTNGELRFRLATRAAYFLAGVGGDGRTREGVYKCFYEGYDQRSRIVHGRKGVLATAALHGLVAELQMYLRLSLKMILLHVGVELFKSGLHKKIDEAIVTGEKFSIS